MKHTESPLRILIVEDYPDIAKNIGDYLALHGHIVDFAMDGVSGMHLILTQSFDVIVLDLMLPGMDGLTLCQKTREEADRHIPILMLTARDTLKDKLTGFEAGADDYLVKPFALEELLARIIALSNRQEASQPRTLVIDDLEMNLGTMSVKRAGRHIELNRLCVLILKKLMRAYPNLVSREELETYLWGDFPPGSDALRSHMYNLRSKVDKPYETSLIQTVHGLGYCIRMDHDA